MKTNLLTQHIDMLQAVITLAVVIFRDFVDVENLVSQESVQRRTRLCRGHS